MHITYRDSVGEVIVTVDKYGISMVDGYAIFGDGLNSYKVSLTDLVSVIQE